MQSAQQGAILANTSCRSFFTQLPYAARSRTSENSGARVPAQPPSSENEDTFESSLTFRKEFSVPRRPAVLGAVRLRLQEGPESRGRWACARQVISNPIDIGNIDLYTRYTVTLSTDLTLTSHGRPTLGVRRRALSRTRTHASESER